MFRSALKSAQFNAPRYRLTGLAVILSVAFLTATLVLTASMTGTANDDIASANWGVDAVVEGRILVEGEAWAGEAAADTRQALPDHTVSVVSDTDGVSATAKVIRGFAKLVDDGQALGDGSALDVGRNWITDRSLNPFEITAGAAPTAAGEVAIDLALAREGGLAVGDPIQVLTSTGLHDATITGIATFGGADAEPTRRTTLFAESVTTEILGEANISQVLLTVAADADSGAVVAALSDALPDAVVSLGADYIAAQQNVAASPFEILSIFLLAFAGIATVVGSTIIYNTFSISLTQRRREFALLRAIGAERRQVLRAVMLEAALIGVAASAVGLGLGLAGVGALRSLMTAAGLAFLDGPLVITTTSLAIAAATGVLVTLCSTWFPARRAASAAPIEALRQAVTEDVVISRARSIAGVAILLGGGASLVLGVAFSTSWLLSGAVLLVPGLILSGPLLVRLAAGLARSGFGRLLGVEGAIASTNLSRSPRRVSSTALAFAIGIALVGFFAITASTLSGEVTDELGTTLKADYVVTSAGSEEIGTIHPGLEGQLRDLESVETASAVAQVVGLVDGQEATIAGIDPGNFGEVFDLGVLEGSLIDLADGGVAVVRQDAKTDPRLGQELRIRAGGGAITAPVIAVVSTSLGGFDAPSHFLSKHHLSSVELGLLDNVVYVVASGEGGGDEIRSLVASTPGSLFETRASYLAAARTEIDDFVNFLYAMLVLTVIIALVGITNTTTLAMNERTREFGLLRAVGTTSGGIRRIALLEATLLAALGAVVGLVIAVGGAWSLLDVAVGLSLVVPWLSLAIIAICGIVAGVLAALYPGWRASRRPTLDAIATV